MSKDWYHLGPDEMIEAIISELKEKRIRITEPRKAIISYMVKTDQHPTVEMIYKDLLPKYPGMSLATVYNNLNALVDLGYVNEMKFLGITSHYDIKQAPHYHLYCENCGKIMDVDSPEITQAILSTIDKEGIKANRWNVELIGLCSDCAKESK